MTCQLSSGWNCPGWIWESKGIWVSVCLCGLWQWKRLLWGECKPGWLTAVGTLWEGTKSSGRQPEAWCQCCTCPLWWWTLSTSMCLHRDKHHQQFELLILQWSISIKSTIWWIGTTFFLDIRGSQRSNPSDFFFCCHYQIVISPNFGNEHHLSHLVELLLEKTLKSVKVMEWFIDDRILNSTKAQTQGSSVMSQFKVKLTLPASRDVCHICKLRKS